MTRDHHHSIFAFYTVTAIVVAIAAATILGCGFVTEGIPSDDTSSSTGAPERDRVRPPRPEETTSTTSDSDAPSESVGDTSSTGSQTTEEGGSSSDGQPALTSESSSGDESSSTGDPWAGFDAHHCAGCDPMHVQYDAVADACWCTSYCGVVGPCEEPEQCITGRCAVPCVEDADCPTDTDPPMVCGTLPGSGIIACLYLGEGP